MFVCAGLHVNVPPNSHPLIIFGYVTVAADSRCGGPSVATQLSLFPSAGYTIASIHNERSVCLLCFDHAAP